MARLIFYGIAFVAIIGGLFALKSSYDGKQQAKGYERAVAEYAPKVKRAEDERDAHRANLEQSVKVNAELVEVNKQTIALYKEQEVACLALGQQASAAQERTRQLLASMAERHKRYEARIVTLIGRVNAPPVAGENACEESDAIVRDVLRDRLRDDP